jgi:acyl-CoA reductase-like NAD-dependent aldehyde dehydrogenase
VDRTADPDQAIPGIIVSAFGYQGEVLGVLAVIVLESLYDAFVRA